MKLASKFVAYALGIGISLISCKQSEHNLIPSSDSPYNSDDPSSRTLSNDFKDYWFDGKAEITSYQLEQERYGELRKGHAVTIFVTEDFLPEVQVKANNASETTLPVLKLNQVKKYITGIYPYSVMTSVYTPLERNQHALKISHSMQEWCGHVYLQLNNRKEFELTSHSYFEGEADDQFSLPKSWLENELWNLVRIHPEALPTGDIKIVPSFEFCRMSHQKPALTDAFAKLMQGDSISIYTLTYPQLKRELSLYFNSKFPYEIERWEETHPNGLKSVATKLRTIKSAYWQENGTRYEFMRDSLLVQ
ncbi:MAG TPA: septum formation inhibitor Maf [Flavobacteriaceae bacterium]|nr:septum formation inhibitor Maf [Flavobacteriaceae bacterium]MCB9214222.1 septum formation inhibitor Maf [Alteromonas sp.]HPF10700.1 septum formation inhibitor Maf [Flavobacteriaceae bacterium]HQU21955.1 septum formation inhibitor Maf [Flavobacteriaceae bacterium]HQU66483.1 septum formation inhibitor Maf [Flavobacteriaceae bacterium]